MKCPSCSSDVVATMNFCSKCGHALEHGKVRGKAQDADRRPLTILFCDLVGSTAMSEQLDPEELQEVLTSYQQVCVDVVRRFDGHIAQYLGDGVLIYLGFPKAHEDDARRAVNVGLGIIEELGALNDRVGRADDPLKVRIGIHTGLVVTAGLGPDKQESLALGQAPNIAARIQGMARPNNVAISEATNQLTEGYFRCKSLGTPHMKGVSEPIQVYEVLSATEAKSLFDVAVMRGLKEAVGREEELSTLREKFELSREDQRQLVMINAEAGIGKSRLVAMFHETISDLGVRWVVARCSSDNQHSSFAPLIDFVEYYFGFSRADADAEKLEKLKLGLARLEFDVPGVLPFIADLLELPAGDGFEPVLTSPEQRKQAIIKTIVDLLARISHQSPIVFLVEDLHWADPSTIEFLRAFALDSSPASILGLFTYRPSFDPDPYILHHATKIELDRLSEAEVEELVRSLAMPLKLPQKVVRLIVDRTDGVALFAEELTKMILDSDQIRTDGDDLKLVGSLDELAVPKTLHSSLVERLDRLGAAKEVAQLGAVLGREFSYEMLQLVSPMDDALLREQLDTLEETQLLVRVGRNEHSTYGFRHALIQDAAYESLLKRERARHHRKAADAIVQQFPEVCETRPELVAYHFANAGVVDEAINYWQLAGERAVSRFANAEAITHYSKAVDLVGGLQQSTEQLHRELVLQTALGAAHSIHDGWQAPGTAKAYERAFDICKELPDAPEQFWVLWQLGAHYQSQEIAKGHAIAKQLVRMAEAAGDPTLLVEGRFGLSAGLFLAGRLGAAYENLLATEKLYDESVSRSTISPTGQNIAVNNLLYLGIVETLLGRPSEGLQHSQRAIDLAREHAGPPHQAAALCWHGFQLAILGQSERTLASAEAALPLATDFFLGRLWASMLRGWALARCGADDEAIPLMKETIDTYRSTGMRLLLSWLLTLQADGLLACGEHERCIQTASEGFDASTDSGEAFARAELYRILGEAQRNLGRRDEARDSLENALAAAEEQGAVTLAFKSTLSYARLLLDLGEDDPARERLDQACQTFNDNAEFPDFEEALVLRKSLG